MQLIESKLIGVYNNYISDEKETIKIASSDGKVKPDANMGYISSVDQARENLENLFKIKPESKES